MTWENLRMAGSGSSSSGHKNRGAVTEGDGVTDRHEHTTRSTSQSAGPRHEGHDHGMSATADRRYLAIALVLILLYMTGEVIVGIFAHSLALFADAGHMLTDAGALAGAMWAIQLARRPSTPTWSYGLKRAEILAAAANGVTLLVVAMVLLGVVIQRLLRPTTVQGLPMLIVACVGVVVNLAATLVLARGNHRSLNMQGAFQHIVTDLYGIGATAIAGAIILATRWDRADPIASLVVVVLVLRASWGLLRASGHILLEGTPETVNLDEVRQHLQELPEVLAIHDLHAWTLTSNLPALTAHVVVTDPCLNDGGVSGVLDRLQNCLAAHFDVEHSTFQIEAASHAEHEAIHHD
jgi:cobalt-zinc-cadmium efflux system protein